MLTENLKDGPARVSDSQGGLTFVCFFLSSLLDDSGAVIRPASSASDEGRRDQKLQGGTNFLFPHFLLTLGPITFKGKKTPCCGLVLF